MEKGHRTHVIFTHIIYLMKDGTSFEFKHKTLDQMEKYINLQGYTEDDVVDTAFPEEEK